jgi:S-methylmethionine-dependent homocysteine/selenocysteine methylase
MPRPDILSRLQRGDHLLLDGGTGSELHRRGVNVSRGSSVEGGLGAWSATAMEDAPDVVRQVHEDYLRVGADIVTANSYNSNRGQLARVGLAHKMEEFSRLAVVLAREARDRVRPAAYVAGAIAPTTRFPTGWDPARVAPVDELRREWGDQAAALAEAGADLVLIESMSAIFQLRPAVEAAAATGLPVFLGIHAKPEGTTSNGESMDDLVAALRQDGRRVDAILLMCSPPAAISATLPRLRAAFPGPIGAYANIGYRRAPEPPQYPERQYHVIETGENTPERYAAYGREWLAAGAQIVGGCCATTPDHIAALAPLVKPS